MKLDTIEALFKALNEGNIRYLVAGGLAVVAHGCLRLTADIDLILDMDPGKRLDRVFSLEPGSSRYGD